MVFGLKLEVFIREGSILALLLPCAVTSLQRMDVDFLSTRPDIQEVCLVTALAQYRMGLITTTLILQCDRQNWMTAFCTYKRHVISVRVGRDFSPEAVHNQIICNLHQWFSFCRMPKRVPGGRFPGKLEIGRLVDSIRGFGRHAVGSCRRLGTREFAPETGLAAVDRRDIQE